MYSNYRNSLNKLVNALTGKQMKKLETIEFGPFHLTQSYNDTKTIGMAFLKPLGTSITPKNCEIGNVFCFPKIA